MKSKNWFNISYIDCIKTMKKKKNYKETRLKFVQKLNSASVEFKRKKIEETQKRNSKGWRVRMPLYTFLGEGVGMPTRHDGRLMRRQLVSRPGRTGVPATHPPPPKTSPRRPLEEDGDRRVTSTCRWSRREVPTCRSPLVAARSRRVSWAGYQERGGVRPSSASRRWPTSGVDGGVPWRQSSGVATLYQEGIRRCGLTRGWGWMARVRRFLVRLWHWEIVILFVKNNIFVIFDIDLYVWINYMLLYVEYYYSITLSPSPLIKVLSFNYFISNYF